VRTWQAAPTRTLCTGCNSDILKGELFQSVRIPGVSRIGKRCRACADDSPELQREPDPSKPLGVDFTSLGEIDTPLTRDHKMLRLGAA